MKSITWICFVILLISLQDAGAQSFAIVKTWKFDLPHGTLKVDLKSSPDGRSSLGIEPNGQSPEAPISEQLEPLRQVLNEMQNFGLDPRRLIYVGTRYSIRK
jgi:hypothetical protein